MIASGRVGDAWSVLSEAVAYYTNKRSDWLRLTSVATPGLTAASQITMENPTEYLLVLSSSDIIHLSSEIAEKYYDKLRTFGVNASQTILWVTYDENIKTPQDLVGKKVNIPRRGAHHVVDFEAILREWGVLDKVTVVYGGWGECVANLKDGLTDVTIMRVNHIYPMSFTKGPLIEELETKGPIYYLGTDPELTKMLRKEPGVAIIPVRVFAGALDKKTQPEVVWAVSIPIFFGADMQMDEDVVYEVTRVLYESAGEFAVWHPQGANLSKDFIPAYLKLDLVHPGAVRYFEEHGIKMVPLVELFS